MTEVEGRGPSEVAAIDFHRCSAKLKLFGGRLEAAAAEVARTRELMERTVDPPYQSPMYAIEAELALWQGRPVRCQGSGCRWSSATRSRGPLARGPLLWLGLWAEADAAVRVGGRRGRSEGQHGRHFKHSAGAMRPKDLGLAVQFLPP